MGATENIILGIVAGVLTSSLLAVLGVLVTRVVLPWYRDLVYRGIDLEGDWRSQIQEHGANYIYQLSLQQRAHDLSGTATITKFGAGPEDYQDVFAITGFTWEGYVSLTLRSISRKRLSFANALLRTENRGGRLVGHWAYRSGRSDQVESERIVLERAPR